MLPENFGEILTKLREVLGTENKVLNEITFADSFKQAFKDLLANTNNEKLALIAIGPQIGILLEGFRELGLKPPKWLRDLAKEAEAAGASLEPPEGLPDILADIRDLLAAIAIQLGAVSAAADDATGSFQSLGAAGNQVKVPKIPGSDDGRSRSRSCFYPATTYQARRDGIPCWRGWGQCKYLRWQFPWHS
jgi:hypothetical protein